MYESLRPVSNGNGTVRSPCLFILFKHGFEIYNLEMDLHVILLETMILKEQQEYSFLTIFLQKFNFRFEVVSGQIEISPHHINCTSREFRICFQN